MTYSTRARTPVRRIRIRRIRAAGLVVLIVAIATAGGYQLLASSPWRSESPLDALGEALPGTVWPAHGQAAVQIGPAPVQAGPMQRREGDDGLSRGA